MSGASERRPHSVSSRLRGAVASYAGAIAAVCADFASAMGSTSYREASPPCDVRGPLYVDGMGETPPPRTRHPDVGERSTAARTCVLGPRYGEHQIGNAGLRYVPRGRASGNLEGAWDTERDAGQRVRVRTAVPAKTVVGGEAETPSAGRCDDARRPTPEGRRRLPSRPWLARRGAHSAVRRFGTSPSGLRGRGDANGGAPSSEGSARTRRRQNGGARRKPSRRSAQRAGRVWHEDSEWRRSVGV